MSHKSKKKSKNKILKQKCLVGCSCAYIMGLAYTGLFYMNFVADLCNHHTHDDVQQMSVSYLMVYFHHLMIDIVFVDLHFCLIDHFVNYVHLHYYDVIGFDSFDHNHHL